MDDYLKPELQTTKIGRPVSNFIRTGVPSKICFLCYGEPRSKYEVSMALYGKPMKNVQDWMTRLVKEGYLEQVKREVIRVPKHRPKGDTGYQLVALKLVEEFEKTLEENTKGNLSFNPEEKQRLTKFFDLAITREFVTAMTPSNIGNADSYDLCSLFSPIFWMNSLPQIRKGKQKDRSLESQELHELTKYANNPRFLDAMAKVGRSVGEGIGAPLSPQQIRNYTSSIPTLRFGLTFHTFIQSCSSDFLEKLRWSMQPSSSHLFTFSRVADKLPSQLRKTLRELKKSPQDREE